MSDPSVSDAKNRRAAHLAERDRLKEQRKAELAARRKERDLNDVPEVARGPLYYEKQANVSAGRDIDTSTMSHDEILIQKARNLQDDNQVSLKNSIKVAREAAEVGSSTLQKLGEQTEQFHRMEDTLDATNESIGRSERILRGMKSIGGAIANMFSKGDKKKSSSSSAQRDNERAIHTSSIPTTDQSDRQLQQQRYEAEKAKYRNNSSSSSSYSASSPTKGSPLPPNVPPEHAAAYQEFDERKQQEDEQLGELSSVLTVLKEQSLAMQAELKTHDKIIDRIDEKVDSTSSRLKQGSRTMAKIT